MTCSNVAYLVRSGAASEGWIPSVLQTASLDFFVATIQAQRYRELGVVIVKGRAECLLALLECSVPDASPRTGRSEKRGDGVWSSNAAAANETRLN